MTDLPGHCQSLSVIDIGKGYERLVSLGILQQKRDKRRKTDLELEIEDRGHWTRRGERDGGERREKGTRYRIHWKSWISTLRLAFPIPDLAPIYPGNQTMPAWLTCLSPLAPWMPVALRALFAPGSNAVAIMGPCPRGNKPLARWLLRALVVAAVGWEINTPGTSEILPASHYQKAWPEKEGISRPSNVLSLSLRHSSSSTTYLICHCNNSGPIVLVRVCIVCSLDIKIKNNTWKYRQENHGMVTSIFGHANSTSQMGVAPLRIYPLGL